MQKFGLVIFLLFSLAFSYGQFHGTFVGLGKTNYDIDTPRDPDYPKYINYHLCHLTFKGDSVSLEESPISIYKKDTMYSASDGGFYSYVGKVRYIDGSAYLDLKLKTCDYCPRRKEKGQVITIINTDSTETTYIDSTSTALPEIISDHSMRAKILPVEIIKDPNKILVDHYIYRRKK